MSWGVCTVGKVFLKTSQRHISSPKIRKVSVGNPRKTNLQLFSDNRAGWSKEPQWENDYGSFSTSACNGLDKLNANYNEWQGSSNPISSSS